MSTRFQRNPAFTLGSPWGDRIDPITRTKTQFHSGQDYKAKAGTPIPAEIAGEVIYSGFNNELGNTVIVKHHDGGYSLYAHMLDGDRAELGRPVWPGEVIGRVGSTGARATGNHLHYTLIQNGFDPSKANGGPIGIKLRANNTRDPSQYDVDPPHLNETLRAHQIMEARNTLGGARAGDRSGAPFAEAIEPSNAWQPGWSVPAPLRGLPGLLMEHASGPPQQNGLQSSASMFKSGAPALPFVLSASLLPDESEASFEERFKPSLPVRRLSSGLPWP